MSGRPSFRRGACFRMREPRVLILGATGQMGARLMRLLGEGLEPDQLCGASRAGPEHEGHLRLDVHKPPAPELIQATDVIIDAVGPYRHDPTPWLQSCAQVGAHWVDLSEAPKTHAQVRQLSEQFKASRALTGCSTVPAMAALLLKPLVQEAKGALSRVEVLLSMGSNNPASAGLIYSLLRPLGRPLATQPGGGDAWHERTSRRLMTGHKRSYGAYPCPELNLGLPVRFWSGFDRGLLWYPLRVAAMLTPHLKDETLMRLSALAAKLVPLWRPLGTRLGSLRLECWDERGELRKGLELHARRDGLDIPALPAVWASLALLGTARRARSLDELVSEEMAKADLTRRGYKLIAL